MSTLSTNLLSLFESFPKEKSFLEKTVADSPASPLARLLLLKKYKEEGDDHAALVLQTLALRITNPAWLSFLVARLKEADQPNSLPDDASVPASEVPPVSIEDERADEKAGDAPQSLAEPENIEEPAVEIEKMEEPANVVTNEIEMGSANGQPAIDENRISSTSLGEDKPSESTPPPVLVHHPENQNEDSLAFEPLHTVDYFASQGIKLREEDLTDDKLGQQVKSFTAWLKSMKRLHSDKTPGQDAVIEQIIRTSAESSNTESDVLTEAMAEVLLKQNKVEKAIEMYEKLKLSNPSKSAYFAAKIESLKNH